MEGDQPIHRPPDATGISRAAVSAILPTYNSAAFVSRAIDSVLGQHGDYLRELLVIDDCSTDATVDFVRSRYGADPRLKILSMDRNRGPGAARNRAIAAALGDWIALIDADDAWLPDRLARLMPLCGADIDVLFDNLLPYDRRAGHTGDPMFPVMPARMTITAMATQPAPGSTFDFGYLKPLIRKSFLNNAGIVYLEERLSEDLLFYLECIVRGARTRAAADALYIYTTRVGQLSKRPSGLSATTPVTDTVADLLDAFVVKHKEQLSADEIDLLSRRAERVRESGSIVRLYENWTHGRYARVIGQSLTDSKARNYLLSKLAERLTRRSAKALDS